MNEIKAAFKDWFKEPGAYVLVDGQFGSTGKGVIAAALAQYFGHKIDTVVSNAGPNSGHTSYCAGEKIVLKQLPTFAVVTKKLRLAKQGSVVFLNAGALIDEDILQNEMNLHFPKSKNVLVHPFAARIHKTDKYSDEHTSARIASTGQGTGPALANKIHRYKEAVVGPYLEEGGHAGFGAGISQALCNNRVCFFEVSQGFSLGINSGAYPYTTSRECTVAQALSDASMSPEFFRKSILSVRTFPIRVGNTESGWSGPGYHDQQEIDWSDIGVEPELTTVTKRPRRIFTWSDTQFRQAVIANSPDAIFLNFVNYLEINKTFDFIKNMVRQYVTVRGKLPEVLLLGYGPTTEEIVVADPEFYHED